MRTAGGARAECVVLLMNDTRVHLVAGTGCHIGENPLWHSDERKVYWCDIPRGRLHRYDPLTNKTETVRDGNADGSMVGGFTIEADGALLLFMNGGRIVRWYEGREASIIDGIASERDSRFNDVIADPGGRVFCGSMSSKDHAGRLYRLDPDGLLHVVVSEGDCPNGLAFSRDGRRMFFTDSFKHTIYTFDYDAKTGSTENQRVFLRTNPKHGFPDGVTIDAEDHLWSAVWDGACVVRYTPDGHEAMRLRVPVRKVASVTFGGDALDTLFISTAGAEDPTAEDKHAGALFCSEPGVRGVAEFRSRICCKHLQQKLEEKI
jgi:sugar lactone lactonase YvrE